jgi:hypothetical protein
VKSPTKPSNLAPITESLFRLIQDQPWADRLVIGGGVAFAHYLEYRPTVDADFWWADNVSKTGMDETVAAIEKLLPEAAKPFYEAPVIGSRRWGDTISIEVSSGGRRVYSCQIATRTAQLFPYLASPFGMIQIETFEENLASKMNALVGRGSARDFLDVYMAITSGRLTWQRCWDLWQAKNSGVDMPQAAAQVALHLQGIEQRRPLNDVPEPGRSRARAVREFFQRELARWADRAKVEEPPP